jgi:hypothetical protein
MSESSDPCDALLATVLAMAMSESSDPSGQALVSADALPCSGMLPTALTMAMSESSWLSTPLEGFAELFNEVTAGCVGDERLTVWREFIEALRVARAAETKVEFTSCSDYIPSPPPPPPPPKHAPPSLERRLPSIEVGGDTVYVGVEGAAEALYGSMSQPQRRASFASRDVDADTVLCAACGYSSKDGVGPGSASGEPIIALILVRAGDYVTYLFV